MLEDCVRCMQSKKHLAQTPHYVSLRMLPISWSIWLLPFTSGGTMVALTKNWQINEDEEAGIFGNTRRGLLWQVTWIMSKATTPYLLFSCSIEINLRESCVLSSVMFKLGSGGYWQRVLGFCLLFVTAEFCLVRVQRFPWCSWNRCNVKLK